MIFMQKGFATLEIVLAIMIIAILATTTIPSAARIIDRISLDYETKRLYTDLRFVQEINRSTRIYFTAMGKGFALPSSPEATLTINMPARGLHSWQVFRDVNAGGKPVRELHYLPKNIKISFRNALKANINFDTTGKFKIKGYNESSSNETTFVLTSRYGNGAKIVFNSVGRFLGGLEK